jgi:hypothetical protein
MAPAAAFAEVLEHFVDRYGSGEPVAARRWHPGIATRPLLWLEATAVTPRRAAAPVDDVARRAPRPSRRFTRAQHAALDQFAAFGARLPAGFTRQELRSAFRSLARTFHPDHHPAISASEKARLSALFTDLRHAYEQLKGAS